ncbi:hypothetical protein Val02_14320 [Virgisporangium aliadipatigenens]|uniref:STAS domain-containing protein n=1 Tax=Virgisporangium aliadipatigenens TaxID=741659 RepID=A0A8J4DP53_9ACTN|nr:ATP-binding protein [Virgisporangium aliadipatigenens]GIJ44546.1 hypothetical protein Val02_14320 [Virgisporangium aliadipatigenens]
MLSCAIDASAPIAVVSLSGALSMSSSVDARSVLHKALAAHPTAVLVDVDGLTVDEDIALTVLSTFGRVAAEWPGCPVVISGSSRTVRRDLERMGINRVVPLYDDRAEAEAALGDLRTPRRFRSMIAATPAATATARDVVRRACTDAGLPALADDAELIVTELVGNVIRHVGGTMELMVSARERFLHLAVRDGSPVKPKRVLPDPETGEGGRGLLLVDAVASGWGTSEISDGKVVWATLRIHRHG